MEVPRSRRSEIRPECLLACAQRSKSPEIFSAIHSEKVLGRRSLIRLFNDAVESIRWWMKLRAGSRERRTAAFEAPKRLRQRRDRVRRATRIKADEIGHSSDRDAIIFQAHQSRRGPGDHVEAAGEIGRPRNVTDICVEVGHPDQ